MKNLRDDPENDFRLLIDGSGPQTEWLRVESEKISKDKIKLLGHLGDKERLADLYANADVFVHPNPREPFGIAPLEAMASGISVVAPNSGGVLSYSTDENVWLAEPNAASFAQAVREIFTDENRRNLKIKRALETAAQNTWKLSTDRLF